MVLLRNPDLAWRLGARGHGRLGRIFNESACVEGYRDLRRLRCYGQTADHTVGPGSQVRFELVSIQRASEIGLDLKQVNVRRVHLAVENLAPGFARFLRTVHRGVGVSEKIFGPSIDLVGNDYPDTG